MYSIFEFFVYYCMIPLVWLIGGVGNIIGLIVFSRKRILKIGTIHIYRALFATDILNLIFIANWYLEQMTGIEIIEINNIMCKLGSYLSYSILNWPSLLLVYISVEKFIRVRYSAKRSPLRKKKYQILYMILIMLFNFLIYIPIPISFELNDMTEINDSTLLKDIISDCFPRNAFLEEMFSLTFLATKFVIPLTIMAIFTTLLVIEVVRLRKRVLRNFLNKNKSNEIKRFKRDIKLTVTSILMNLIYIICNGPFAIYVNTQNQTDLMAFFLMNLLFFSYALNFYLIFASNHLVRKEFYFLFSFKK